MFLLFKKSKRLAKTIDGRLIAHQIRTELQHQVQKWIAEGNRRPKLVIILVGSDPASHNYIQRKLEAAAEVGVDSELKNLPSEVTEQELLDLIEQLNNDDGVDGFMVQLPLPAHIDKFKVANAISCDKDVDGFNERNVGRLCLGLDTFVPCAALSVRELLKRKEIETFGKNVVVVGTSKNFGLPIAMLLHNDAVGETNTSINDDWGDAIATSAGMTATVTLCSKHTPLENLTEFCKTAYILITVTGVPKLIRANMVKPGACVIDAGITPIKDESGETIFVGDVDFAEV